MTIYRVEHPLFKNGPYNKNNAKKLGLIEFEITDLMLDEHNNQEAFPATNVDRPIGTPYDTYCAFHTFEELMHWFDGFIDYLLNMGHQILEIELPDDDVFESYSGKQVFFKKDNIQSTKVLF